MGRPDGKTQVQQNDVQAADKQICKCLETNGNLRDKKCNHNEPL